VAEKSYKKEIPFLFACKRADEMKLKFLSPDLSFPQVAKLIYTFALVAQAASS